MVGWSAGHETKLVRCSSQLAHTFPPNPTSPNGYQPYQPYLSTETTFSLQPLQPSTFTLQPELFTLQTLQTLLYYKLYIAVYSLQSTATWLPATCTCGYPASRYLPCFTQFVQESAIPAESANFWHSGLQQVSSKQQQNSRDNNTCCQRLGCGTGLLSMHGAHLEP